MITERFSSSERRPASRIAPESTVFLIVGMLLSRSESLTSPALTRWHCERRKRVSFVRFKEGSELHDGESSARKHAREKKSRVLTVVTNFSMETARGGIVSEAKKVGGLLRTHCNRSRAVPGSNPRHRASTSCRKR